MVLESKRKDAKTKSCISPIDIQEEDLCKLLLGIKKQLQIDNTDYVIGYSLYNTLVEPLKYKEHDAHRSGFITITHKMINIRLNFSIAPSNATSIMDTKMLQSCIALTMKGMWLAHLYEIYKKSRNV